MDSAVASWAKKNASRINKYWEFLGKKTWCDFSSWNLWEARDHPKNALRVFYFDLFCECWGVKIRLIPILDLFYSLSHKLTCFWLVSIKNVGWSSSHSWVKFPRTSAVSTRCQRLTAHFLTLYWDLRRNHFGLRKPFHVDLLDNRLPNKDIWDTTYYLTQLVQHQTLSASFHRRVCAHISTLYSLNVWLVSSLNFPLQITILVINNPNSCISFKSPSVSF